MAEAELSLGAELLLLSIDPEDGGLLPRRKSRFRRAVGGRRRAAAELKAAGLAEARLGRLRLADRTLAVRRFKRLHGLLRDGELSEPRDRELVLLLTWTGVLASRLSKEERRIAARRVAELARMPVLVDAQSRAPARSGDLEVLAAALREVEAGDAGGLVGLAPGSADSPDGSEGTEHRYF